MIEYHKFTENSIKSVMLAQEETRRLGHNFVGSEQLLVGLLGTNNDAARILNETGVDLKDVQSEIEKIIGRGAGFIAIEIPFTPNANRAIATAITIAREPGSTVVKPEHLLFGIISLNDGVALRVLEALGVSIPQLRNAVLTHLQALSQQKTTQKTKRSRAEATGSLLTIPHLNKAPDLYETDFVLWIEQTVQKLRDRTFDQVDWENVIEEIESLGRSDKRALESQVTRVIMHLLKWDYQPKCRSNSWRGSIVEGRTQIRKLLRDSPSLKPYLAEVFAQCYQDAIEQASAETELPIDTFPTECPYTVDEVLTRKLT